MTGLRFLASLALQSGPATHVLIVSGLSGEAQFAAAS